MSEERFEPSRGVYETKRAAALSGVPRTTLDRWARTGLYEPSIAPAPHTRLWSWADLLALRAIDWLRRAKDRGEWGFEEISEPVRMQIPVGIAAWYPSPPRTRPDHDPPPATIREIRRALRDLEDSGVDRQRFHQVILLSSGGKLFLRSGDAAVVRVAPGQQAAMPLMLNLTGPYMGTRGEAPDLLEPRPLLRILPGKLHGEPHIRDTRITTVTLYALVLEGYPIQDIAAMYSTAPRAAIEQAADLERSLHRLAA